MKTSLATVALLCVLIVIGGCVEPRQDLYAQLQSEDPADRIQAARRAAAMRDEGALPYLVELLGDSETDVRFFSLLALRDITDETMGYSYYAPSHERAAAIERWRQWLRARQQGATAAEPTQQQETTQ